MDWVESCLVYLPSGGEMFRCFSLGDSIPHRQQIFCKIVQSILIKIIVTLSILVTCKVNFRWNAMLEQILLIGPFILSRARIIRVGNSQINCTRFVLSKCIGTGVSSWTINDKKSLCSILSTWELGSHTRTKI